VLIFIPAR